MTNEEKIAELEAQLSGEDEIRTHDLLTASQAL